MPPAKMRDQSNNHDGYEVDFANGAARKVRTSVSNTDSDDPPSGPVDLDDLFSDKIRRVDLDETSLFSDEGGSSEFDEEDDPLLEGRGRFFSNPNKRLLDNDASLIPGSPFSKPMNKVSNRPSEPLAIAKYASVMAFLLTIGWVALLFFVAIWNYNSIGRIIVECFLAALAFFGLFWNSYFIIASICKCFIPARAFKTNTKYCSIIPETKPPETAWMEVTIQIPVYKESLQEVMIPTLKSCMAARHYYNQKTGARCNIVICDDGMMAYLRDNFAAAEMLWENIVDSKGRVVRLSKLLKRVPSASRRHLKGLRSKHVYEVFHRMLYYYHYKIGFVARSTVDRRGKFKKASNLNSHLRLALGASQLQESQGDISYEEALLHESHNEDGSRYIMFGNDIKIGHLIVVNDADARMAESVIVKTVPEFLNDHTLGFTQHATKTMNEQRGESYYTNMLTVYTDALYQGHFLLSSIMGCHPPLVGHSIFLRTEAVKQCGRMRTLRKAQRWLRNIGLQFLPVDQVGFSNLHAENRIEYWSESHVSEDFELMLHLYNLGFNGRYCAYPDCEFQEGITRTFDEEAGRHRKFALGAHELVFNPFNEMLGHGVFTPLFNTFLRCDIPSYYKVFLTAYLCSYTSGGAYIIVFTIAAIARILDSEGDIESIYSFSPAGIIVLNIIAFYVLGYATFIISLLRMHFINNKLLFPEYRKKCGGALYIVCVNLRYCLTFQFLFYTVASITFFFLGSMDHMLSRPNICGATNKDSITITRCVAFWEMAKFNSGSWMVAACMAVLAYLTILQDEGFAYNKLPDDILKHALFAGPAFFLAVMAFIVPILLNPFILGWPFHRRPKTPKQPVPKKKKKVVRKDALGRVVDIRTFMDTAEELDQEMERVQGKPDVELGSLATKDVFSHGSPGVTSLKKLELGSGEGARVGRERPRGPMKSIAEAEPHGTSNRLGGNNRRPSTTHSEPSGSRQNRAITGRSGRPNSRVAYSTDVYASEV